MTKQHYTPEQRTIAFWNKIAITADDNQCWLWLGNINPINGYGRFKTSSKIDSAHRVAWMYPDYVIPDGMLVCHSCDNPQCCNPKHLFIGTYQDNVDDMVEKGRNSWADHIGEVNPNSKLTEEMVLEIRSSTANSRELSIKYGVSRAHIRSIIRRLTWKHI